MLLSKEELDSANKDKSIPKSFQLEVFFAPLPGTRNTFTSTCSSSNPMHPGYDGAEILDFEREGDKRGTKPALKQLSTPFTPRGHGGAGRDSPPFTAAPASPRGTPSGLSLFPAAISAAAASAGAARSLASPPSPAPKVSPPTALTDTENINKEIVPQLDEFYEYVRRATEAPTMPESKYEQNKCAQAGCDKERLIGAYCDDHRPTAGLKFSKLQVETLTDDVALTTISRAAVTPPTPTAPVAATPTASPGKLLAKTPMGNSAQKTPVGGTVVGGTIGNRQQQLGLSPVKGPRPSAKFAVPVSATPATTSAPTPASPVTSPTLPPTKGGTSDSEEEHEAQPDEHGDHKKKHARNLSNDGVGPPMPRRAPPAPPPAPSRPAPTPPPGTSQETPGHTSVPPTPSKRQNVPHIPHVPPVPQAPPPPPPEEPPTVEEQDEEDQSDEEDLSDDEA